jgi:hypothetical protein
LAWHPAGASTRACVDVAVWPAEARHRQHYSKIHKGEQFLLDNCSAQPEGDVLPRTAPTYETIVLNNHAGCAPGHTDVWHAQSILHRWAVDAALGDSQASTITGIKTSVFEIGAVLAILHRGGVSAWVEDGFLTARPGKPLNLPADKNCRLLYHSGARPNIFIKVRIFVLVGVRFIFGSFGVVAVKITRRAAPRPAILFHHSFQRSFVPQLITGKGLARRADAAAYRRRVVV